MLKLLKYLLQYIQINVAIDVIGGLINECLIYFLLIGDITLCGLTIGERYIIASL